MVRPAVNAVWERMAGIISSRDPATVCAIGFKLARNFPAAAVYAVSLMAAKYSRIASRIFSSASCSVSP